MAASDFFAPGTHRSANPLKPYGITCLVIGAAYLGAGAIATALFLPDLPALAAAMRWGMLSLGEGLDAVRAGIGIVLGVRGIRMLSGAIGSVTRLAIPPNAPSDLAPLEAEGALRRREAGAFAQQRGTAMGLLQKWFPGHVPLLTGRLRVVADAALCEVGRAGRLGLLLACGFAAFAALPSLRHALLAGSVPSVPWLFATLYVAAATLHVVLTTRALPTEAPRAEVREFRSGARGGGDPTPIAHALQQELSAIRSGEGKPNRALETGFAMERGGVRDVGTFEGRLFVETQPTLTPVDEPPSARALLIAGGAVQLLALGWWLGTPEAPATLVTGASAGVATVTLFAGQLLAAWLLGGIGGRMVASGGELLRRFRFESLAVLLDVRGTYARSHLRIGRGMHDSIESDNLVVRGDVYIAGYCAALLTESREPMGERMVIGMVANERAAEVELLVQRFLWRFERQPATIAAVNLRDGGLLEVVHANLGVEAQRALARASSAGGPPPAEMEPGPGGQVTAMAQTPAQLRRPEDGSL